MGIVNYMQDFAPTFGLVKFLEVYKTHQRCINLEGQNLPLLFIRHMYIFWGNLEFFFQRPKIFCLLVGETCLLDTLFLYPIDYIFF